MAVCGIERTQLVLGGGWLLVIVIGWAWIFREDQRAVQPNDSLRTWPSTAAIQPAEGKWSLIVFLHPRCECAEPTERAFRELMARRSNVLSGHIVWAPDADFNRFGVTASGEALLFDPSGNLRFRGGLTPSRGHTGPNPGVRTILAATAGGEFLATLSPVFGCLVNAEGSLQ